MSLVCFIEKVNPTHLIKLPFPALIGVPPHLSALALAAPLFFHPSQFHFPRPTVTFGANCDLILLSPFIGKHMQVVVLLLLHLTSLER